MRAARILALVSLPYWLPGAVVALRMRIFALVNGEEAVAIPGGTVDAAHFEEVAQHFVVGNRAVELVDESLEERHPTDALVHRQHSARVSGGSLAAQTAE